MSISVFQLIILPVQWLFPDMISVKVTGKPTHTNTTSIRHIVKILNKPKPHSKRRQCPAVPFYLTISLCPTPTLYMLYNVAFFYTRVRIKYEKIIKTIRTVR